MALKISKMVGLLLMTLPFSVSAEVLIVPNVGLQFKNLDLDFEQDLTRNGIDDDEINGVDDGNERLSGDLEASIFSLQAGVTVIWKDLFASLKLDTPISDGEDRNSSVPYSFGKTKVSREDYVLNVGYRVWNGISVFGGYLRGETELKNRTSQTSPIPEDLQFPNYRQNYEEDGLFVGASYAYRFGEVGTISTSLAYADLDGEYSDNFPASETDGAFDYKGSATGLSFSVGWAGNITNKLSYYVDLRTQEYEMDAKNKTNIAIWTNTSVETTEKMTSLTSGVRMIF